MSTSKLLTEVTNAINVLGEDGTIHVLRESTKNNSKNKHIDFVIKIVCEKLGLAPEQILLRTKITKHLIAIQFICYYCHVISEDASVKDTKRNNCLRHYDVALRISRSRELVGKYVTIVAKKKKDKKDTFRQDCFKIFDEQVKKYLKTLNKVA